MGATLLVGRLVLAAVFATAGAAKLADPAGSRAAAGGLGVAPRFTKLAGVLIPIAELATAAALIPIATATAAALAAALLLAAFTAAIARAIARGENPDCHCFGQLHSAAVGARTLARNAALLILATFVAAAGWQHPGVSATHWITRVSAPWLVAIGAGALALLEAPLLLHLLRQNRRLKRTTPDGAEAAPAVGLPVGSTAPEFELEAIDGERHSLSSLTREGAGPLLLVFVDARCAPCDLLLPTLAEYEQRLRIAVVASGDAERIRAKAAEYGLARVLLQRGREVAEAYRTHGTPMGVLVAGGRIVSPTAAGAKAVAQLAQQAAAAARPVTGDQAPDLVLADLEGRPTALAELYSERILLIFWSPTCQYSQRLLPGLHALELEPLPGAPRLIVISDQPAHDVGATVLLDPERRTMRAFGARGTPSAVLVEDGLIASPVVAGPAPVFDLLGEAAALAAS